MGGRAALAGFGPKRIREHIVGFGFGGVVHGRVKLRVGAEAAEAMS